MSSTKISLPPASPVSPGRPHNWYFLGSAVIGLFAYGAFNLGHFAMTMVNDAMHAYTQRDTLEAQRVWTRDTELDAMYTALFRELLTYMIEDPGRISANTQMLFMARAIERIGDRATNISEIVRYLVGGTSVEEERPKANATKSLLLSTASSQ